MNEDEKIIPGTWFTTEGVRYEIISREHDVVRIRREHDGLEFTHGAKSLTRIIGLKWEPRME